MTLGQEEIFKVGYKKTLTKAEKLDKLDHNKIKNFYSSKTL